MVKVMYVAGWQRSGTTVVGNVLGSAFGVVHVGELFYLWYPDHPDNECGCGEQLSRCGLWSSVLADLGIAWDERHRVHDTRLREIRMRHLRRRARDFRKLGRVPEYSERLGDLYDRAATRSGSSLVVDTSKSPSDGLAAALAPGVELYVLHLVRDPRASAYSWSRGKRHGSDGAGRLMSAKGPLLNSSRWTQVNLLAETYLKRLVPADRYRVVRYEELMDRPRSAFEGIADWVGLDRDALPFSDEAHAVLAPSHTVMGNPNRYQRGQTALALDREWASRMPAGDRWMATLPALPLMRRYGYGLRQA